MCVLEKRKILRVKKRVWGKRDSASDLIVMNQTVSERSVRTIWPAMIIIEMLLKQAQRAGGYDDDDVREEDVCQLILKGTLWIWIAFVYFNCFAISR